MKPRSRPSDHHDPTPFVARTSEDLVAIAPVVLGFHPSESVVLLTFGAPGGSFHARCDLGRTPQAREEVAQSLVRAARNNHVEQTAVLVYAADRGAADEQGFALVSALLLAQLPVIECLWVHDGRWFELPDDHSGTAYDLATHPLTARSVYAGKVVHPARGSLVDSLAPANDEDSHQVKLRTLELLARRQPPEHRLRAEALWVRERVRSYLETGVPLSAAGAARMLVACSHEPVRDVVWSQITRKSAGGMVDLFSDLVRRCPARLLPAVSALLAFAAWQAGEGALAWCAVERCVEVSPDYPLATRVADALEGAVPPSVWTPLADGSLAVLTDPAYDRPCAADEGSPGQAAS